ncbi:MAG: hypothetical protein ABIR32_00925, partial [Ilumatobacteraceae bacterium]
MRHRPALVAMVALSLIGASCNSGSGVTITSSKAIGSQTGDTPASSGGTPDSNAPDSAAPDTSTIDWTDFGNGLETGSVIVPIDYDDPSKGNFDLFVLRHPAADPSKRIGT